MLPGRMISKKTRCGRNATRTGKTTPPARPNRTPGGVECSSRAKIPAATPAISPLNVEPIMIPTIAGRTAGVNQAVPPSIAPSNAPTSNPSTILFMHPPPFTSLQKRLFSCATVLYNAWKKSFELSAMAIEDKQGSRQQIDCYQQDSGLITNVKSLNPFPQILSVGRDTLLIQVSRDVFG